MSGPIPRWLAERRRLADEDQHIDRVKEEAASLIEELRARRDGLDPAPVDLPALRAAVEEVRP